MITAVDSASTSFDADDATTRDDVSLYPAHIMDPVLEPLAAQRGNKTRTYAGAYAYLGYPVTCIKYGEKRPYHTDWQSPYVRADGETTTAHRGHTYDQDVIVAWFPNENAPDDEIGLVTNGLVVVDFDIKERPWTEAEMADAIGIPVEELQQVPAARTPSGGWHFFFADETDEGKYTVHVGNVPDADGKPIAGLDIRARGGQVKVYPGVAQRPLEPGPEWTGRYEWVEGRELPPREELPIVPPLLASRLTPWAPKPEKPPGGKLSLTAFDSTKLAGILESQEPITGGSRNATLFKLGSLYRGCMGMDDAQLTETLHTLNTERCEPPLSADEVERIAESVCKYAPEVKPHAGPGGLAPYEALAYEFIADCEHRNTFYRWHAAEKRYYRYDGMRYTAENAKAIFQTDLLRWIGTYKNEQGERPLKGRPTGHRGEMLPFLEQLLTIPESAFVDKWEQPFRLCENGWLDLSPIDEGKDPILLPHTPNWFSRLAPMPAYDPNATAPNWEQATREILHDAGRTREENEELYRFIMRAGGSCLHPLYHTDTAGVFYGGGENGKSTILAGIQAANGIENSAAYSFKHLSKDFTLADLVNYNAIITNELPEAGSTDESTIKSLLTGDEVTAEIKHGGTFKVHFRLFMLFATNELPKFADKGRSILRRFWYVPCPNTMVFDVTKRNWKDPQTWVKNGEASGILNLLIAGAKALRQTGYTLLDIPTFIQEETKEAVESASLELEFLKNEGPLQADNPEDYVTETELYTRYARYAARHGRGNSLSSLAVLRKLVRRQHGLPENRREMIGPRGAQTPVIRKLRWANPIAE